MSNFTPTDQQRAAIDYEKSMVITACPGSGKTTVMKEKIRGITPELPTHKGVIAITFTKKASEELKRRCNENAHNTKRSFFGTIDSFCLKELILPFLGRIWGGDPSGCKIVKKLDSHQKLFFSSEYKSPTLADLNADAGFKTLYDANILWMSSFAALSLEIINNSISAQRYIKARYSHVFIDEYQDSSKPQHEIFIKLFELGLIATAVGDVDQSIYRFRGSEPKFLSELISDTAKFNHFNLDVNHRCHPSIVNYASRILEANCQLIPHDDICVYRRLIEGNLKSAGETLTSWISGWLKDGTVEHASDIAILAKKSNSLIELSSGFELEHRLYADTPLNDVGTECADIYSDLLLYKNKAIGTAQDIIEKYYPQLSPYNSAELRSTLKAIKAEEELEPFIERCNYFISLMGINDVESESDAIRLIWSAPTLIKLFKPVAKDEVQFMTLHKSKGLEFKIVIHFDLEEWSFPYREMGQTWDDVIYPSIEEDTNLHYVGITRAEKACILIRTSLRRNAMGEYKNSRPSYFLGLPQLEGLYN